MEKAGQLTGIGANINGDNAVFGIYVPVAQLDRVLASEARGFGFNSRRGYFP
jgi:hypothetical protein